MNHSLPSPLSPGVESRPGLLRALGPGMAVAVVVGNVIGSGIFLKPGAIAEESGSFPLIISAWICGGILCLLGALCFAELGAMLPRAGGLYVYLREAYGRPVAFLFGFNEFLFNRPASIGALSVAFIEALSQTADWKLAIVTKIAMATCVIAGVAWVNVIGVVWGGTVQAVTTVIKGGGLLLAALLAFAFAVFGESGIEPANYATTIAPASTGFAAQFGAVLLAVMWAYNGWHGIASVAEEIREPQKNIPRALFLGVGFLMVLYVFANVSYHGVLSMDQIRDAQRGVAQAMVGELFLPYGERAAWIAVAVMAGVILCSTSSGINSNLLLGPRVTFAMGRDDTFFRVLGRAHVNFRTPAAAILVQAVMGVVMIIVTAAIIRYGDSLKETAIVQQLSGNQPFKQQTIFGILTNFVVFSSSIFYMLCVLAVFVFRWRNPEWERPYRTWGYPVVPAAFLLFYCWFMTQAYFGKPLEARVGLGLIAAGLPVYFAYKAWAARHPEVMHDGQ